MATVKELRQQLEALQAQLAAERAQRTKPVAKVYRLTGYTTASGNEKDYLVVQAKGMKDVWVPYAMADTFLDACAKGQEALKAGTLEAVAYQKK